MRKYTKLPLAVGFGISTREHVVDVAKIADGAVVGSAIILAAEKPSDDASSEERAASVKALVSELTLGKFEFDANDKVEIGDVSPVVTDFGGENKENFGYGKYGGRYIPETLVKAHEELFVAWKEAWADPEYHKELARLRKDYVGGPTPLWLCERLTEQCGGARIWLKREDLAHTGAHKINNALGQVC